MITYPIGLLTPKSGTLPTDGLIAYYPFNGNANDESGNGNNGTVTGATLTTDRKGTPNSAYLFNNQYITITKVSDWNALLTNDFTISLWIYPTSLPTFSRLIGARDSISDGFEILLNTNSKVLVNYNNLLSDSFAVLMFPNTWYNIILTKESNILKLYFDNVLNGTTFDYSARGSIDITVSPRLANFATSVSVGLIGKMDDVRFYNRALTTTEITQLYNE